MLSDHFLLFAGARCQGQAQPLLVFLTLAHLLLHLLEWPSSAMRGTAGMQAHNADGNQLGAVGDLLLGRSGS